MVASAIGALLMGDSEIRMWSLPFTIGRSSKNTLTIRDPHLSRSHCEIHRTREGYEVRNLSSRNPVRVNGHEVSTFLLHDGDEIQLSKHRFVFRLGCDVEEQQRTLPTLEQEEKPAATSVAEEEEPAAHPPTTQTEKNTPEDSESADPSEKTTATEKPPANPRKKTSRTTSQTSGRRLATHTHDRAFWAVIATSLGFIGLLAMGALIHRQGNGSRRLVHAGVTEMQKIRSEISQLRMELGQTRNAYVLTERETRKRLRKLTRKQQTAMLQTNPAQTGSGKSPAPRRSPSVVTGAGAPASKTGEASGRRDPDPDAGLEAGSRKSRGGNGAIKTPKQHTTRSQTTQPEPKGKSQGPPMIPFFGHRILKKRIAFVVDKSSSMKPVMEQLYTEMDSAIDKLTDAHLFTIIFFDGSNKHFSRKLMSGTNRYKSLAKRFIRLQQPKGATDPLPALKAAMQYPGLEGLVFVTDGNLTETEFSFLHAFLLSTTSGKLTKNRVRLYIIHLASMMDSARSRSAKVSDRLQKLLDLAEKQDF